MSITETVLEMHYHRPLMDLFRSTYGLGAAGKFTFYKYSPQREVFLGFDQAFAMTELSDAEFFQLMRNSAMNREYKLPSRFVAYFLQFKIVNVMHKCQKQTPSLIRSRPHYRCSLDTTKNDRTGFSQHELLFNLCANDGAMVYYACPMIFDKADLYEVEVNLDPLRLVDLTSCNSAFTDNSRHYIYFDQPATDPVWCSEPVEGRAVTASQLVESVMEKLRAGSPSESAERVLGLLSAIKELGATAESWIGTKNNGLSLFADSLTVVRFTPSE